MHEQYRRHEEASGKLSHRSFMCWERLTRRRSVLLGFHKENGTRHDVEVRYMHSVNQFRSHRQTSLEGRMNVKLAERDLVQKNSKVSISSTNEFW
jgi:hypothetical protein